MLEAKLGKFPKASNELHSRSEISDVRRHLQGLGLLFAVRQDDGADMDVILNTVGVPIPGHEFRIMAEADRLAEVGESGEVQVRGDWIMAGYWNRPEATAEAIDAERQVFYFDVTLRKVSRTAKHKVEPTPLIWYRRFRVNRRVAGNLV